GVVVAECLFKEASAEGVDDVADDDFFGAAGQGVAAFLAAGGFDESAFPEDAQNLGGVGGGNAFGVADLRDGESVGIAESHQTAEAVLFVGGELHRLSLVTGM